jgi:hypothetical protein
MTEEQQQPASPKKGLLQVVREAIVGWGCAGGCLGALVPGPIGFKDQGRGGLMMGLFLIAAAVGSSVRIFQWYRTHA